MEEVRRVKRRRAARARRPSAAVTLESVAERAGVAPATVSRALNHPHKVAPETLARVNAAIAQTGYLPNLLAGGLASSRSRLFAAIVPSIANLVYAETIQSFTRRVREKGYQVLLGESGYDPRTEEDVVTAVLGRRPDAIFLIGINHSLECRRKLLAAKIPIVETWDVTPTPLDVVVGYAHDQVGRAVADFLLGQGYAGFACVAASDARALKRQAAFAVEIERRGGGAVLLETTQPGSSLEWGRQRMAALGRDEVLHVGLFDVVQAVGVIRQRGGLGEGDLAHRAAADMRLPPARVEAAEIGQRQGAYFLTSGHWLSDRGQASESPGMVRTML